LKRSGSTTVAVPTAPAVKQNYLVLVFIETHNALVC
jgi:hypothetical protein